MRTYQFESIIQDNGCIFLPEYMKKLKSHHVKLTLVDMEPENDNPVNILADIIRRYASINEDDLDIVEIYKQREEHYDRGIMFD
ncbi:MAG: hypothetical protein MUF15_08520 [Acidobacteria bacterium]|jgi:hypothetical protein|nr:hypothetical protein [Acidobacteriota bacterium]